MNEADAINALNFGTAKHVFHNSQESPLVTLLNGLAQDVTDKLGKSLDKYDANASYNLRQGIFPRNAFVNGSEVSVSIEADFYWKFVEYGFNGWARNRGAPTWTDLDIKQENIQTWMIDRGIKPNFGTMESASFAITKALKRDGKEARPFFTDVVNEKILSTLQPPIEKLIGKAITLRIIEPWQ
jgi:hypothetical protein